MGVARMPARAGPKGGAHATGAAPRVRGAGQRASDRRKRRAHRDRHVRRSIHRRSTLRAASRATTASCALRAPRAAASRWRKTSRAQGMVLRRCTGRVIPDLRDASKRSPFSFGDHRCLCCLFFGASRYKLAEYFGPSDRPRPVHPPRRRNARNAAASRGLRSRCAAGSALSPRPRGR
jgi:hypothetical protein